MGRRGCLAAAAVIFALFVGPVAAYAEEPVELAENYEWEMGIVKAVSVEAGVITVTTYNFEEDKDVDVAFFVDEKTEFIGKENLSAVEPGDDIEVSYKTLPDGKKQAITVIVAGTFE